MNALGLLRTLGPVDLRNVRREPLLAWSLGMPLSMALILRWGVPALADWLARAYGFDLTPYYPLLVSGYFLVAPAFIGFVVGFLLLDERDDRVLDAMRVTPVSLRSLLTYRIGVPLVAGVVITLAGYGLLGLVPLPASALLTATLLAAFSAPIQALVLVAFAENKVSGFALMKLSGAVNNLPIVAWFLPMPWQLAGGVIPSYWPMKVVWQAAAGAPWAGYALVGLGLNLLAVVVLLRRFQRVLAR